MEETIPTEKKKRGVVKGTIRGKYKPRQPKIQTITEKEVTQ